jgi:arginine decarboxylase
MSIASGGSRVVVDGMIEERLLAHAPLLRAWAGFVNQDPRPFTIPGHQRQAGSVSPLLGRLLDADVPLYGGLDSISLEHGVLAEAEAIAAHQWDVDWCRYSTGGATHANQAALLAAVPPGATVLVGRNAHRSTLLGLVLCDARPIWLPVEIDPQFGLPVGVRQSIVQAALTANRDSAAVVLVSPSYAGLSRHDLPAAIDTAHRAGVPVIVDQAWGATYGFDDTLAPHAPSLGADLVVISAHKGLPTFSQGAILLAHTERLDPDALDRGFDATNTTSPAGAILASIDAGRAILAEPEGSLWLRRATSVVAEARDWLNASGLRAIAPADFADAMLDPLKFLIQRTQPHHDLRLAAERLAASGHPVEMSDRDTIVAPVGFINPRPGLDRMVQIILDAVDRTNRPGRDEATIPLDSRFPAMIPEQVLTPREAFFAAKKQVPASQALGRISAEVVAPYPPGIPVLIPGEIIDEVSVETLRLAKHRGIRIAYAADPTLRTFGVVS